MNRTHVPALGITAIASELIWQLVDACDFPDSAGVRIAGGERTRRDGPLELALVERPEDGDEVVMADGARVFFDPEIAGDLHDTVLDAKLVGGGRIRFALRDRGGRRRAARVGNGPS